MSTPWSNQAISLIVLTEQTSGFSGIFGYSPTVAAGNLIFSIAAKAGTDPEGNTYPAGLSTSAGNSTIEGTDYVLNSNGLFMYASTPANGNLILSVAQFAGTDAYSNSYPAGLCSFNPGIGSSQVDEGTVIVTDSSSNSWALSAFTPASTPYLAFSSPTNGTPVLFMNAAGALIANEPGDLETPEALNSLSPYLTNSWSVRTGGYLAQYYLTIDNRVQVDFQLTHTGTSGTSQLTTALPSGYWPALQHSIPCSWSSTGAPTSGPNVSLGTNGTLTAYNLPSGTTIIQFSGTFPLA